MAEVFKAIETQACPDGPLLAIKRILPTMAEDDDFITMFLDEARIASHLEHPSICRIFEMGSVDETNFIAMEYIHGKDLLQLQNKFRKQKQIMPVAMAAYVGMRAAEGLDYAHKAKKENNEFLGIIHRDISPQNILVSYQGDVKVIDFGIAKAQDRQTKTQAGILKGKFGYMSPEQVLGKKIDHRSDLFALGTVIYEMLTGERLFVGESDFSTLEKVRNVDIHPPRHFNDKIPEKLEKIILKALAKDRDQRYSWCIDLAADLKGWLDSASPYDSRKLSQWMQQAFVEDLTKDREKMSEFRALFSNGAIDAENEHGEEVRLDPGVGKTEIFDSAAYGLPAISAGDDEEDAGTEVGNTLDSFMEGAIKTEIFDSNNVPGMQAAGVEAADSVAPTIVPGTMSGPPKIEISASVAMPVVPPRPPVSTAPSLDAPMPAPKATAKGRSLVKDVLLGVGLAAFLIAGVAVYFLLFQNSKTSVVVPPQSTSAGATGIIKIETPAGATVMLDGKEGCQPTPCEISQVTLGTHTVQISHPDYKDLEQGVKLSDIATPVVLNLPMETKSPGKLKLLSIGKVNFSKLKDSVSIFYKGQEMPFSAVGEIDLPSGKRTIEIRRIGYQPVSKEIQIPTGGTFDLSLDPTEFTQVTISIKVESTPTKAIILLDGKKQGESPLTISNLPGAKTYNVTARLEGYEDTSTSVRWTSGPLEVPVALTMNKAKATGNLMINSFPLIDLLVEVDGKNTKLKTPVGGSGITLSAGKHTVFFIQTSTNQRFGPYPVEIKSGETTRKSFNVK
jgi:serine/threonine protein kinase